MSDKIKNVVVTITFLLFLFLVFLANVLKKDMDISLTERRELAKFPDITIKTILNGSASKKWEKYTTDQMVKREEFKNLKSTLEMSVFHKRDNNGIYEYQNNLIKIEYPLNEKSVLNAVRKINEMQNKYFNGMKCYYAIIPDKNYFVDKESYIRMDYERLEEIMLEKVEKAEYIPLFDCLELKDYYVTDIHWKQENLQNVVNRISTQMGFRDRLTTSYQKEKGMEFDGLYAGRLPTKTKKDEIWMLTNEVIENAKVYHKESGKQTEIYDKEKWNSNDKYDIYLSGPTPLITIENTNAKTDKELIVVRDSFASSLIPLFTEAYHKITLVDIRYMRSKEIENNIDLKNQEVLFLYSTLVLNNSSTLK